MSERQYKKSAKVLQSPNVIVVVFLLFAMCIFWIGYTALFRLQIDTVVFNQVVNAFDRSVSTSYSAAMRDQFSDLIATIDLTYQSKLEELRAEEEASQASISKYDLYNSYVDEIIDQYYPSLDPELIRAIIYNESRYDANARNSKSGAAGLMQLLPKWHTQRALNLGVTDLYDPYGNILTGCDFLNELMQKYPFNYAISYYAGGSNYANSYGDYPSAYQCTLNDTIAGFRSGAIQLGGE